MQEAGGRRQEAGGRRQEAGGRRQEAVRPLAEDGEPLDWVEGPVDLCLRLCCSCIVWRSMLPVGNRNSRVFRFLALPCRCFVRPRGGGQGCAALCGRL